VKPEHIAPLTVLLNAMTQVLRSGFFKSCATVFRMTGETGEAMLEHASGEATRFIVSFEDQR
jgi:hypothetical protein